MDELKKLSDIIRIRIFMALRYPESNQDIFAQQLIRKLMELFIAQVHVFTVMGKAGCGKGVLSGWYIQELNRMLPESSRYETIALGSCFRNILKIKREPDKVKSRDFQKYAALANLVTDEDLDRMKAGEMMSDQTVINVVNSILKTEPYCKAFGLYIDGFPRNLTQARILESGRILWHGKPLMADLYVYTHIAKKQDALFKKRAQMRVAQEIARASLENRAPEVREDDRPEVLEERLITFYQQTEPGIRYILKRFKEKSFKIQGTTEGAIEDSIVMDRAKFLVGWMLRSGFDFELDDLEDIRNILAHSHE